LSNKLDAFIITTTIYIIIFLIWLKCDYAIGGKTTNYNVGLHMYLYVYDIVITADIKRF